MWRDVSSPTDKINAAICPLWQGEPLFFFARSLLLWIKNKITLKKKKKNQIFFLPEAECAAEFWVSRQQFSKRMSWAKSSQDPGLCTHSWELKWNWSHHWQNPYGRHFGTRPTVQSIWAETSGAWWKRQGLVKERERQVGEKDRCQRGVSVSSPGTAENEWTHTFDSCN